jgi:hypothetical protein
MATLLLSVSIPEWTEPMIDLTHFKAHRRDLLFGAAALAVSGFRRTATAQTPFFPDFPDVQPLPEIEERAEGPLKVATTTSIIGDLVAQIGGGRVEVTSILPANADPRPRSRHLGRNDHRERRRRTNGGHGHRRH